MERLNGTPKKRVRARTSGASRTRDKSYQLTFREVAVINSSLSDDVDISRKRTLGCNKSPKRCFQGKVPGYPGFMLDATAARRMASDSAAVVHPYLIGRELLDDSAVDRWAIDFRNAPLLEAQQSASAFAHVRDHVLPEVDAKAKEAAGTDNESARVEHLERWWQFWNRRDQLNEALARCDRVIGCSRTTRRPIVAFISSAFCLSDLVQVFAFDDDYSFGVLQGKTHFEWFRKSSRLKVESDTRYSVRSVFETMPWPQAPTKAAVLGVAKAGREVRRVRDQHLPKIKGGLRALYRTLELPGKNQLKDAHAALDAAVLKAYGFNPKADLLKQLLDLNLDVAAREKRGESVTAPGVPPCIEDARAAGLMTDDCIRASE